MNYPCFRSLNPLFCSLLLLSGVVLAEDVLVDQKIHISHAIAMHGSPKYAADFKGFEYTSRDAQKGGSLKQGLQGNFDSFNGFIAKGTPADQIGLIYDSLTVASGDEAFTRYGLVAEKIEWPEDRSWVIFHLRQEAKFHDGHSIDANDVVFTFNILVEKGNPLYRSYYRDVEKVTALSTHTVRFDFKTAENKELPLIISELPVLPEHYWETRDFSKSSMDFPLGSGPYRIQSADAGRNIIYQRVEDYWAKDLPVNRGMYNFDTIQLDYYKDGIVVLEALKAKEFDFGLEYISKQWATAYTGPAIEQGLLIKAEPEHENPTGMQCFLMNLRNPLFQDIRVRQAMIYAFDYEWSNKNLFYNAYKRTSNFFSNSELASIGIPEGREKEILSAYQDQLPASVFEQPYTLPVSKGDGNNRDNLRKAVMLLREAGWTVKNNQLVNADGKPFVIEMMIVQPSMERVSNPYAQALKKLGITLVSRHVEVSQYINRMRSFDYDMVAMTIGQSLSPGNEQYDYWHSESADIKGSRNFSGIKNPVVDELVAQIITAPSREELVYRTRALDRVLLNNHYVIPHWHKNSHRIAYWDKFAKPDISPKYDPSYQLGLKTWWVDPLKEASLNKKLKSLK